jgi:hypothetical protein
MSTRYYLHSAAHGLGGAFPTSEQDAQAPNFSATGATTLRAMDKALGSSMVNLQASTTATTSNQAGFMGMWTTAPLSGAQTVGGGAETLTVNVADYESSSNANFCINRVHAYVWRPSSGAVVDDLCTYATVPSGSPSEPSASSSIQVTTFSVPLSSVSADDGDVIIVEMWANITQAAASAYTVRLYYDGTSENAVENTVVSNHAAFVEFSQDLVFTPPEAQLSNQSAVAWYETTNTPEAQLSNQSAVAWYETTNTPEAQLLNQSVVVWYVPNSTRLYRDDSGQLVISDNPDPTWTPVADPGNVALSVTAPFMREQDALGGTQWHPATYYDSGPESTWLIPGGNLMPNADLAFGADYWQVLNNAGGGTNYSGPTRDLSDNAPAGSHSVGVSRSGTTMAASDVFDIVYNKRINVLPSTRYELSAYLAAVNCTASIFVKYYKLVAGVETAISSSDTFAGAAAAGGSSLNDWSRAGGFITTPSDAQYLKFCVRGSAASAADPVFWASKLFVGQAYPGQTELSPWVAGGNSGSFGELEQLSSSTDEYVATFTVPTSTLTTIASLTLTSVISPARVRKILLSVSAEGSQTTTQIIVTVTSGSYAADKVIFDRASQIDCHILAFPSIISVPAGYDADVTLDLKVKHNLGSDADYNEIYMSALELPS